MSKKLHKFPPNTEPIAEVVPVADIIPAYATLI